MEAVAPTAPDLARRVRAGERRRRLAAFGLTLPLCAFLLVFFVLPILGMLRLAVSNTEMAETLPRSTEAFRTWEGGGVPPPDIVDLFARELAEAHRARSLARFATRLNYEEAGLRSLVLNTGRRLARAQPPFSLDDLAAIDPSWRDPGVWAAIRRAAQPWTDLYVLAALDLQHDAEGRIVRVPPERAIYLDILGRTFRIAAVVTLACLVIGYPLAYTLAHLPERHAHLLMIGVLLPFWTSLLVRTAAWIVILQREGPLNELLQWLGLIDRPLELVFHRPAVYIAMTHVLLPFMVLPIYSVMRTIHPSYVRAALSLGATPWTAFRRVYLPLSLPGVSAGCLLVFILALGYYITPALVGGATDQMISWFIAFYTLQTVNWGMAAALGSILLLATLALYLLFARVVGIERLRLA
ncbi:Putrescine transport system permease protein PotH [bacterium HR39]|nr:Putrescine transport system permease protein PotH [bacterium HR39]